MSWKKPGLLLLAVLCAGGIYGLNLVSNSRRFVVSSLKLLIRALTELNREHLVVRIHVKNKKIIQRNNKSFCNDAKFVVKNTNRVALFGHFSNSIYYLYILKYILFTKTNTSEFQFDLDVKRLNTSPWFGRPGDHSLRFSTLNKVFIIIIIIIIKSIQARPHGIHLLIIGLCHGNKRDEVNSK